MGEIIEFFAHLLKVEYWPARWLCGIWTPFHGWLYILSSIGIGTAYFAIPVVMFQFVRKREDLPFVRIFWLFIAFILACGATHFMDALVFWYPAYRLSAVTLCCTALISWMALIGLWRVLPVAITLKSPAQLEAIIEARTLDLASSHFALKKANEDLDNYVYAASHNLKSPISNIEGLLGLLKEQAAEGQVPDAEIIDRINESVARVQSTITSLTDVVKMQKNPYEDTEWLQIEEMVSEIRIENESLFSRSGAVIQMQLSVNELFYSRNALKSTLYNLMTNAVKYASPDRRPEIWIRSYRDEKHIFLEVEDNGMGIDLTRHKDKMFALFKRLHTHVEGSGVGLYFTKQLVEKLGGRVEVESVPGQGSVFRVVFIT
ncbi:MAG: sensor histidine kinase [Bacteroidetes bacterium]|nr:MAG: sensor histidine kinase [Bacteroidota bacterium]